MCGFGKLTGTGSGVGSRLSFLFSRFGFFSDLDFFLLCLCFFLSLLFSLLSFFRFLFFLSEPSLSEPESLARR